jgi:hypothetical protein
MALLPYSQIGDNLYADSSGKYFNLTNGSYTGANGKKVNGQVRSYVQSPFDARSKQLNTMYDAQRKTQLDALRAQQQKQIKDIKPTYQAQRNSADVVNAQNVSRLRELMAANGINASGENITASANLAAQRQGAMNEINTNEQSAIRQIQDPSQEQAIINNIEAQRSQALAGAYNQSQQDVYQAKQDYEGKAWREYAYNNMSASEKAQMDWAKQQYGEDAAWRMYELNYNGQMQQSANQSQIDAYTSGLAGIP